MGAVSSRTSAEGETYDFRIHWPPGLWPEGWQRWQGIQREYENWSADEAETAAASADYYRREIDSVKEIYELEFRIDGRILDVGRHQGRLRHYLPSNGTDLYVVVDPFLDVFENVTPSLLRAYPCLEWPVNFICGYAEFLPVAAESFDWVHLRSVLDHLCDPWLALKEAWRVLRPGGRILVGLTIEERVPALGFRSRFQKELREEGLRGLAKAVRRRVLSGARGDFRDHTWRLTLGQVRELCKEANFRIRKEKWQKPPWSYVLWVSAEKVQSSSSV